MDDPERALRRALQRKSRKRTARMVAWAKRVLSDGGKEREKWEGLRKALVEPSPPKPRPEPQPREPSPLEQELSRPGQKREAEPKPEARPRPIEEFEPRPKPAPIQPQKETMDALTQLLAQPAKPKPEPEPKPDPVKPEIAESPREKWAKSMAHYTDENLRQAAALDASSGPLKMAADAAREELERRERRGRQ